MMKSSKNIVNNGQVSNKKAEQKNKESLEQALKQQVNINQFIDNLEEKTQATIYKQKLRIKAYNLNDIRQLEEIKQKVEKLRKLQQENTEMQKKKEELNKIKQEIEETKQFNQTLQKNLDELVEQKSSQDQYQLYLNQQVEQRKDLYKKSNDYGQQQQTKGI